MTFVKHKWLGNIAALGQLQTLTHEQLECEATKLLGGDYDVGDADKPQYFYAWQYTPVPGILEYREPTNCSWRGAETRCEECGRLRYAHSASLCRFCYQLHSRLKYIDHLENVEWLHTNFEGGWEAGQKVGVVMPETPYWDTAIDLPANSKSPVRNIREWA